MGQRRGPSRLLPALLLWAAAGLPLAALAQTAATEAPATLPAPDAAPDSVPAAPAPDPASGATPADAAEAAAADGAAGAGAEPGADCVGDSGAIDKLCLARALEADPGQRADPLCRGDLCYVEMTCEVSEAGARDCAGPGYRVAIETLAPPEGGLGLTVTGEAGQVTRATLCGTCDAAEVTEGSLRSVQLYPFHGGALLEVLAAPAEAGMEGQPAPGVATASVDVRADAPLGYFNLRDGPSTRYEVVGRVPAGTRGVALTGPCGPMDDGGRRAWCPVEWNGTAGWISVVGLESRPGG